MALLHQVLETAEGIFDQVENVRCGLRLTVARQGAEMVSLQAREVDGGWKGFLHRDGQTAVPPSGWANHATVMGYFLHRLWQERSTYRGEELRGGNHGFLRHFEFGGPELEEEGMCYRVGAGEIPEGAYPLRVGLELRYRLTAAGEVEVEFLFGNEEPELEAHVSFGLHPGFAVAGWRPEMLQMPAGTYLRHLAPGNFLNGKIVEVRHDGGAMPFAVEDLPGSYLLELSQVPDRRFILCPASEGWRVELDFSECPYVTLWSEGADYLCVEPCWGLPDANPPTTFEEKPGIQIIPAGGCLKKTFRLRPIPAQ